MICEKPGFVHTGISEESKRQFSAADRDKLDRLLADRFRQKKYDRGLLEGLADVYDTIDINESPAIPAPVVGEVKDHAGLFSRTAIDKANESFKNLPAEFTTKLVFETVPHAPPGRVKDVELMTADERSRFFADWVAERMRVTGADGIHVLICKQPLHVEVGVGSETAKKAFTAANRDQLRDLLVDKFKSSRFDEGLNESVNLIRTTLRNNLGEKTGDSNSSIVPKSPRPPSDGARSDQFQTAAERSEKLSPTPNQKDAASSVESGQVKSESNAMTWIIGIGVALLALWILFGLFRALFGHRNPPYANQPPGQPPSSQAVGPARPGPAGGPAAYPVRSRRRPRELRHGGAPIMAAVAAEGFGRACSEACLAPPPATGCTIRFLEARRPQVVIGSPAPQWETRHAVSINRRSRPTPMMEEALPAREAISTTMDLARWS